jgi:hypothetical protein
MSGLKASAADAGAAVTLPAPMKVAIKIATVAIRFFMRVIDLSLVSCAVAVQPCDVTVRKERLSVCPRRNPGSVIGMTVSAGVGERAVRFPQIDATGRRLGATGGGMTERALDFAP